MQHSACFIGHRTIKDTPELRARLQDLLSKLVADGTAHFIFGDHSAFDRLCYEAVTALKEKHPDIRRIHFRRDYEDADEWMMRFLLPGFEESICPPGVGRAGRGSYIERNRAMVEESEVCVFYYNKEYRPPRRKHGKCDVSDYQPSSGTGVAYDYAVKRGKRVINLYEKS